MPDSDLSSKTGAKGPASSKRPAPKPKDKGKDKQESATSTRHSTSHDDLPENDVSAGRESSKNSPEAATTAPRKRSKSPAYVAPIEKIGSIPPIARDDKSPEGRPALPRSALAGLEGKLVDEYGDVLDEDGTLFGRVAGDLPSMVGRFVSNKAGDVLGDDGELLGYVSEVESCKKRDASPSSALSLDDYVAQRKGGFCVDEKGNILNDKGEKVGRFHDYNTMGPKPPVDNESRKPDEEDASSKSAESGGDKEKRPNAQSFRKEGESPSDIFLDVKSTTEGIQLTIRIPTVFPDGRRPNITFS